MGALFRVMVRQLHVDAHFAARATSGFAEISWRVTRAKGGKHLRKCDTSMWIRLDPGRAAGYRKRMAEIGLRTTRRIRLPAPVPDLSRIFPC
jgi:hypothetical protein